MGKYPDFKLYTSPLIPPGEIMYLTKNSMEAAGMALDKEKLLEALQEIGTDDPLEVDIGTTMKLMGLDALKLDPTPVFVDFNVTNTGQGQAQIQIPDDGFSAEDFLIVPDDEMPVKDKTSSKKKKSSDVVDEDKSKAKTKTFKADTMVNGFMLQSNPLAEGSEPFYMEAYLLGKDEFYIAGGMSGTLNLDEMKVLRKKIKFLVNQMKESYPDAPEGGEKKGGKAVLKIAAPWIPSDENLAALKLLVDKEMSKVQAPEVLPSFDVTEIVMNVTAKALSQLLYEKNDGSVPDFSEQYENMTTATINNIDLQDESSEELQVMADEVAKMLSKKGLTGINFVSEDEAIKD